MSSPKGPELLGDAPSEDIGRLRRSHTEFSQRRIELSKTERDIGRTVLLHRRSDGEPVRLLTQGIDP